MVSMKRRVHREKDLGVSGLKFKRFLIHNTAISKRHHGKLGLSFVKLLLSQCYHETPKHRAWFSYLLSPVLIFSIQEFSKSFPEAHEEVVRL